MIDGKKGEDIIAHELFHQWFGDLVTSESWSNLPLNESFATYGEYLWEEYKNGRDAADIHHAQSRSGYMMSDKEVNLIRFNYENREDMFDAFSYNKGGQVLHMLRKAIGDDAFFASLKNYLETNKFKTGEIHQLRLAFEEVTGKDMNWFFNQWFLSKGRPNIKVSKNYNSSTNEVELTVEQKQDLTNTPLYQLPIDIDIYVNGKAKRTRIWANEQKQTFKLKCDGQPQLVNFDAERQLLCDLEYIKTTEEYIFQYKNAPLYDDRIEALRKLEPKITENDIYELFKLAAQNDKFSPIRNYALNRLDKASSEKMADVKSVLLSIYENDKKTTVRASALAALNNKFANDADVMALNEKALSEVSYAIVGEALQAITKSNPKLAMERAKQFETEFGKDIIFPLTDLYAANGSDDQIAYFQNAMKYINGFELLTFSSNYAKTAKRCKTSAAAMAAAADLEGIALASGRMTRYAGVKGVKDILGVWITKEKQATTNIEKAKKENKDVSGMEKELKEISSTKEALQNIYNKIK
jgi:aminopeptidase N